jgi:MraZ protein
MFFGEHQHTLDPKGRVILPAKFRPGLEGGAFVTSEVDGCLAIWTPEDFEVRAQEMRERSRGSAGERQVARAFFGGTAEASIDGQGRMAIPLHLREFARLEPGRGVVITGQFDRIEIWDGDRWQQEKSRGNQALAAGTDG